MSCREFDTGEALVAGFLNRVVPETELDPAVQQLAECIAAKPAVPVVASKRHVNAITAQMVGTARAWSDADSLIGALQDPECGRSREAYLKARRR